jgi:hypothetical protein
MGFNKLTMLCESEAGNSMTVVFAFLCSLFLWFQGILLKLFMYCAVQFPCCPLNDEALSEICFDCGYSGDRNICSEYVGTLCYEPLHHSQIRHQFLWSFILKSFTCF